MPAMWAEVGCRRNTSSGTVRLLRLEQPYSSTRRKSCSRRRDTSTGTVRQKVRRIGTVYTIPKDVIRLSEQYDKMLDATYSSTRRTIMLHYILLIYYYYIIYYHTIVLYIFIFLLFGFHFISNFAVITFRKSLTSLFNCQVGIPFSCTSFCTPSKSFLFPSNTRLV